MIYYSFKKFLKDTLKVDMDLLTDDEINQFFYCYNYNYFKKACALNSQYIDTKIPGMKLFNTKNNYINIFKEG